MSCLTLCDIATIYYTQHYTIPGTYNIVMVRKPTMQGNSHVVSSIFTVSYIIVTMCKLIHSFLDTVYSELDPHCVLYSCGLVQGWVENKRESICLLF